MTEISESSSDFGPKQYQEPDPGLFKRPKKAADRERLLEEGWRVCAIHGLGKVLEPPQEGVLRYPPVQVEVPRRPDFIEVYVSMGPTDWSQIYKKDC